MFFRSWRHSPSVHCSFLWLSPLDYFFFGRHYEAMCALWLGGLQDAHTGNKVHRTSVTDSASGGGEALRWTGRLNVWIAARIVQRVSRVRSTAQWGEWPSSERKQRWRLSPSLETELGRGAVTQSPRSVLGQVRGLWVPPAYPTSIRLKGSGGSRRAHLAWRAVSLQRPANVPVKRLTIFTSSHCVTKIYYTRKACSKRDQVKSEPETDCLPTNVRNVFIQKSCGEDIHYFVRFLDQWNFTSSDF